MKFNNLLKCIKLYFCLGNMRAVKHIVALNLKWSTGGKKCILFPDFNLKINVIKQKYFLRCIRHISKLYNEYRCKFEQVGDCRMTVLIEGSKYNVNTYEEIVLLYELFIEHTYDIKLPDRSIVLDVGMNNADSTIYFASKKNVDMVRGFEPFKPTFEVAKTNISLNSGLINKIEIYNYGLGEYAAELECDYSQANTAGAGLSGILGKCTCVVKESVRIVSVSDEIKRACEDFPNHKIVLKIDTEGSEFDIISKLAEDKLLGSVKTIILEWHEKSPQILIDTLLSADFTVYNRDHLSSKMGMIYAFR